MKPKIEKISKDTEKDVIQFLTIATLNEVPNKLLFPDPVRRIFHTFRVSRAFTKILGLSAERYLVRDENGIAAVGMWLPPRHNITTFQALRYGLPIVPFIIGFRSFFLMMKLLDVSAATRDQVMKNENHWYLLYLVYQPRENNINYENMILDRIISESQLKKESIFTHCFSEDKLRHLEKAGFFPVSKIQIAENCIMHSLVRIPHSKSKSRKIKYDSSSK